MPDSKNSEIQGWSGYKSIKNKEIHLTKEKLNDINIDKEKLLGRGHGCSFGDQALLSDGMLINSSELNFINWVSESVVEVGSGVEIRYLLSELLPLNKGLVGVPGGLQITIGGAISNNIHGKDHWKNGNFSENILSITYMDNNGKIKKVFRENEIFHLLIGGMGLFGFIVSTELKTTDIQSPWIKEKSTKINSKNNFIEFVTSIKEGKLDVDYSVTWLDFSKKKGLGRGISLTGEFIDGESVSKDFVEEKIKENKYVFNTFSTKYFWDLAKPFYNQKTLNLLSSLKYNATKNRIQEKVLFYTDYMWIDNRLIPEYRKLYEPKGFVEIQPLISIDNGFEQFFELLDFVKFHNVEPLFPSVKLHKEHEHSWTFAGNGLSICLDLPVARRGKYNFEYLVEEMYKFLSTLEAKVYLAKDSTLSRKHLSKLAPGVDELIKKRKTLDGKFVFDSEMAKRLFQ